MVINPVFDPSMSLISDLIELKIPLPLHIALALLLPAIICILAIPAIVRLAKARGLVAEPNGRTTHNNPTPNLGGIAIFAALILSILLLGNHIILYRYRFVLASMTLVFFLGVKDDFYPLVAIKKFIGQLIVACIVVIAGDIRVSSLQGLLGIYELGYIVSVLISVLLVLSIINSFNLIDGVDGLASGVGIISSLFFGIWFLRDGMTGEALQAFILLGSLLVFYSFNMFGRRYKIFLGDSGAMIIGFLVAVLAIQFNEAHLAAEVMYPLWSAPVFTLCILVVPLFDIVRIIIIRIAGGKSPFVADTNHIHHYLLELFGSHTKVTSVILTLNMVFIAIGLVFNLMNIDIHLALLIIVFCLISLSVILRYIRKSVYRNQALKQTII